jgi:hypothetical protein
VDLVLIGGEQDFDVGVDPVPRAGGGQELSARSKAVSVLALQELERLRVAWRPLGGASQRPRAKRRRPVDEGVIEVE